MYYLATPLYFETPLEKPLLFLEIWMAPKRILVQGIIFHRLFSDVLFNLKEDQKKKKKYHNLYTFSMIQYIPPLPHPPFLSFLSRKLLTTIFIKKKLLTTIVKAGLLDQFFFLNIRTHTSHFIEITKRKEKKKVNQLNNDYYRKVKNGFLTPIFQCC